MLEHALVLLGDDDGITTRNSCENRQMYPPPHLSVKVHLKWPFRLPGIGV